MNQTPTKQIQTVLNQLLQTFRDKFVKNENGFEVVQPYAVEEYERFLEDFYRQARQEAVERTLQQSKLAVLGAITKLGLHGILRDKHLYPLNKEINNALEALKGQDE